MARVAPWGVSVGAAFAALAAITGLQDHDYFWHLTTGRLIVTEGLPRTDPFSFTYAGGDWILHEWGGEVLLYLGSAAFGTAGLIVLWSLLLAAALVVMALGIGRLGGSLRGTVAGLSVAGLAIIPYASLRPVMLSLVFIAGLVWVLLEVRDDRTRHLLLLPPLFAVWANVHGFWALGLGILALFIGASWLGWTAVRAHRHRLTAIGVAAGLATLLTPYSVDVLLYPFRYVDSGDWGLDHINEWQSPDFHEPAHWPLLAMLLLMVLLRGRIGHRWLEISAWVAIGGSLYALRLTPVAAILSGYAIALAVSNRPGVLHLASGTGSLRRPRGAWKLDWGFATIVVSGSLFVMLTAAADDAVVNPELFPVGAVDLLAERDPAARVLADYAWGGYVIHRLSAESGSVFVDGRNDMYPQAVLEDYTAIREGEPTAAALLDAYGATAILLRPDAALLRMTAALGDWCRVFEDDVAVLLLREPCEGASSRGQDLENADGVGLEGWRARQPIGTVSLVIDGRAAVP